MARPERHRPSTRPSKASASPAASAAGRDNAVATPDCTIAQTSSSIGSMPVTSARIQSAPPGIFAARSPYPEAVRKPGAAATTSRSMMTTTGALQLRVTLTPFSLMGAPAPV